MFKVGVQNKLSDIVNALKKDVKEDRICISDQELKERGYHVFYVDQPFISSIPTIIKFLLASWFVLLGFAVIKYMTWEGEQLQVVLDAFLLYSISLAFVTVCCSLYYFKKKNSVKGQKVRVIKKKQGRRSPPTVL